MGQEEQAGELEAAHAQGGLKQIARCLQKFPRGGDPGATGLDTFVCSKCVSLNFPRPNGLAACSDNIGPNIGVPRKVRSGMRATGKPPVQREAWERPELWQTPLSGGGGLQVLSLLPDPFKGCL